MALLRSMRRAVVCSEGRRRLGRLVREGIRSELRLPGRFCSSWMDNNHNFTDCYQSPSSSELKEVFAFGRKKDLLF